MLKFISLPLLWIVLFAIPLRAEPMAPELLDLLNEDPSLLLDPGTQITEPPASSLPLETEREPASSPKTPEAKKEKEEEKKSEAPIVASDEAARVAAGSEVPPSAEEEDSKPDPGALQVSFTLETSRPEKKEEDSVPPEDTEADSNSNQSNIQVSFTISAPQAIEVAPEPVVAPPTAQKTRSELEALPGVGDHAIILDGNQFFPATIKMKAGSKGRLLFITTSQKPAALVFVKPSIQRWVSSTDSVPSTKPIEEFREFSHEKIAQIPFEADPGTYEFYDALSGARGEIKVE